MSTNNENNFTIVKKPISLIGLFLMLVFFILRFKNIYEPIQIGIYILIVFMAIYSLYEAYKNDKKNRTTNFKEKIIVATTLIILGILSYFIMPYFFR